jgi:hypothetical protein
MCMLSIMNRGRARLGTIRAAISVLIVALVLATPPVLFGQPVSAFGLLVTSIGVLALGWFVRIASGSSGRTIGSLLVVIGALLLAVAGRLPCCCSLAGVGVTDLSRVARENDCPSLHVARRSAPAFR